MSEQARPRVLVVDDEIGVRESLRAILQRDFQVMTASNGNEALVMVAREPVDIVTLDLNMPGMGGVGVLERVKQIDPDIEVMIITGKGTIESAVQGLRLRAFDYLSKPFDCDRVRGLVQMAAARRMAVRRMKTVPEHLLSTLSHELRTPLNVILGYSNMLQDDSTQALSDDQKQALDRIQANSESLLAYVETIFYMAELDRGLVSMSVTPVPVGDVLARVAAEFAPRATAKGIGWTVDVPPSLTVASDADKMWRMIRALADNAVQYTHAGAAQLSARRSANGLLLEIQDSGPGLPPEVASEAEDLAAGRFGERAPAHLGFGLRLAGRLARALGAVLRVTTTPQGTTWQVGIPDLALGERDLPATAAAPAATA